MSEVFYTSDTHFNHRAMIEKGWRKQFSSVEEMNEHMIDRWNGAVSKRDIVFHLGDFGMGSTAAFLAVVSRLNGKKHLIAGNHDPVWPGLRNAHAHQRRWMDAGFVSIQAFARRKIDNQDVMLSHFPYQGDHAGEERFDSYRLRDSGLWLIHGHVHEAWRVNGKMINVGVDVNDFTPVHVNEIAKIMRAETQ